MMLLDVTEARPLEPYRIWIRFEDGAEGVIDLSLLVPFAGVFAPLRAPEEFARLRVDRELGTIVWPCGADLDPLVLYAEVTGGKIART